MKKILTPFAFLLICHLAFSQECHLNWGEIASISKLDNGQFLTGMSNNSYYIITANKYKKIQKFNPYMAKTAEKDYNIEYEGVKPGGWKGMGLKNFIHTRNFNYVGYQHYDPKNLKTDVLLCKLDDKLDLGKPQKPLTSKLIPYTFKSLVQGVSNGFIGSNSLPEFGEPIWCTSADKTMMCGLIPETVESKYRNFEMVVMDENMNEQWKKAQTIQSPEEKTQLQAVSVSNDGSAVALSARVYDADKIFIG